MTRDLPDIRELVPHRPPMLLLDEALSIEERSIRCGAAIDEGCVFLDAGRVDPIVCLELVAQAVAAYVGFQSWRRGEPVTPGFLVSCREAAFEADALEIGDRLEVVAEHTWGEASLASFRGRVERGGRAIATLELGVYRGAIPGLGATA